MTSSVISAVLIASERETEPGGPGLGAAGGGVCHQPFAPPKARQTPGILQLRRPCHNDESTKPALPRLRNRHVPKEYGAFGEASTIEGAGPSRRSRLAIARRQGLTWPWLQRKARGAGPPSFAISARWLRGSPFRHCYAGRSSRHSDLGFLALFTQTRRIAPMPHAMNRLRESPSASATGISAQNRSWSIHHFMLAKVWSMGLLTPDSQHACGLRTLLLRVCQRLSMAAIRPLKA